MIQAIKSWFGLAEEESIASVRLALANLPPEEIQAKMREGRESLIREYKLRNKPQGLFCGKVGIENLGNTCFMASALQCLSNCKPLTLYLLSTPWEDSINSLSSLTRGRLVCEFYLLLRRIWCEEKDYVLPVGIKNSITKVCKTFAGFSQQDSQEFLSFFLDSLHEDLNQVVVKPYEVMNDYTGQDIDVFAEQRFLSHLKRNNSKIVGLFHGQFYSKLQCPDCHFVSASCDPFDIISMNIPSMDKILVEGYFLSFTYEKQIKEFSFNCSESEEVSNALEHICKNNENSNPLFFRPYFYIRSKISEKPAHPYTMTVKSASENEGILFLSQVFEPETMEMVFEDRAEMAYQQLKSTIEYSLRVLIFVGEEMVGIEREIVVPDMTTSFDVHFLIYLIYRSAFISAGIQDTEELDPKQPKNRETALKEFARFWPSPEIEIRKSLFSVKVNGKELLTIDKGVNLFNQTFENLLNVEVLLNPKKNLSGLKLKKCSKEHIPNLLKFERELSLQSCFETFTQEERLDKENMWFCTKCRDHKQALKKMTIQKAPEILIIHLKRFRKEFYKHHFVTYKKNSSFIDFPLKGLDVSPFMHLNTNEDLSYNLFAVSNHYGNCGAGHYTAFCRNFITKKWYCFDDRDVSKLDDNEIVNQSAYVLFYQKNKYS